MDRHWRAELGLAGVALIWGSTFVLVKQALSDVSPALFVAIRFSLAAVLLWALFLGRPRPEVFGWRAGGLAGCLLFAGYLLQTLGLRSTTPAKSGFLTGLYIILVPVLSAVVYGKAPALSEWLGVGVATVGLGLMTLETARLELGTGELLTLGCAFMFAVHILVLGRYAPRMDAGWLALLQVGTCAIAAWISVLFLEMPFLRWRAPVMVALFVTSVLATAVAFYVQTWAQRHTTNTRAAMILALEPVFAWVASFALEGELLHRRAFAGALCILAGILLVELKPMGGRSHPVP